MMTANQNIALTLQRNWEYYGDSNASRLTLETGRRRRAPPAKGNSGSLQNDGFQNISHVLALVGCRFQNFVDFLPFDDFNGRNGVFKQPGDTLTLDAIPVLLQLGKLIAIFQNILRLVELGNSLPDNFSSVKNDPGQLLGPRSDSTDFIDGHPTGHRIHQIQDVVQRRAQCVDVFPVKG